LFSGAVQMASILGHRQLDRPGDELVGAIACLRGELPEGKVVGDHVEVDAVHLCALEARLGGIAQRSDLETRPDDAPGLAQAGSVSDHQRPADVVHFSGRERLHDDLGPDAGGVAHGDRYDRTRHDEPILQHRCGSGEAAPQAPGGGRRKWRHRGATRPKSPQR